MTEATETLVHTTESHHLHVLQYYRKYKKVVLTSRHIIPDWHSAQAPKLASVGSSLLSSLGINFSP